jgi:hypothetical protein
MEQEIWKDVKGFEGLYQVSNFGLVKSIERITMRKNGRFKPIRQRILKACINSSGYYLVRLSKNGVKNTFFIHKLVAINFLNHIPNKQKVVIDHKDGNKLNNIVENIQTVTHRENSSICFRKNTNKFTSKYIGVSRNKREKKWVSNIYLNGKIKHIGYFDNEIEASNAYQKELKNATKLD